ncbi:MAG: hypothetical protein ACRD8A_14600 [Candidatus Acidiferrales bacterium]
MTTNFKKLVGEDIALVSPLLGSDAPEKVRVHGVDYGGIWIESQKVTDSLLQSTQQTMSENTPLIFVPFSKITFAVCGWNVPAISSEGIAQTPPQS